MTIVTEETGGRGKSGRFFTVYLFVWVFFILFLATPHSILSPQPEIEPASLALEVQPNHWTIREVSCVFYFYI